MPWLWFGAWLNMESTSQTDDKGNNVLHTLLNVLSHPICKNDEHVITMYHSMTTLLSVDWLRSCLYQEDAKGLQPLELAASLGHFRLMNAIFHTPVPPFTNMV